MRIIVVEPPAAILTYQDAVARLKLDGDDDEQADVEAMIAAATAHIDGPDGWLGRALGPQTLEIRFDGFDEFARHGAIFLPCPPTIDVISVTYVDPVGAAQTLAADAYELLGRELIPAFGQHWPVVRHQREAVRIRYRAGYAADPSADPLVARVPAPITAAILLMVGDLYSNRETTVDARASAAVEVPMSTTVTNLLAPYRMWA